MIKNQTIKKQTTILSLLVLIAIALGYMISSRFWLRLDLSKNRAYTISRVSRNLHTEIPDQVRITYYVSDKLKAIHPMPGEIEDLLREYATYSRGKIQVMVRDPIKTGVAELVERMGIQARQIQTMEQDQAGVVTVFSGIVIDYLEQIDVIPFVFSLSTLEYDVTSRIRSLVRGNMRQAGIIAGDNPRNINEEYGYMLNALAQSGYRLRLIAPGLDISDDLPLLIVLGGVEMLDDTALYQIDRYIQTGGKVLFTAKAISIDKAESIEARILDDQGLLAMLASYGVSILPEIVMDRSNIMMQYETRTQRGTIQRRISRNAQWIRVLPENGNPDHPIGARFGGVDMYWASPMELSGSEALELVPLITTTPSAWSMREPFYTNPDVAAYLFEKDAAETKGVKILGASLSGVFPSWFADKPKPEASNPEEELPDMPESPKPARVIVMSDTDFLTSFLNVSEAVRNLDFLLQALDWLGNDDDIIGIRNRESNTGDLGKILDPAKKTAAVRFAQTINIIIMPLLVILAGVFIALRRRAKSRVRSDSSGQFDQPDQSDQPEQPDQSGLSAQNENNDVTADETIKEQSDEV